MQCLFWGDWQKSTGPKARSCFLIVYTLQDIKTLPWDIKILVCSRVSLTSWGQGASLSLVDCPFSDGVTIKMSYRVDILLHRPALHPIFAYFLDDLPPWRYMSRCFLVALCCLVLWRVNLKVATKRHLHQQLKIPGSFRAKFAHESVLLQQFLVV